MSGNRTVGYRPGAPIPYRPDQPPQKRYGFHPAQYHKAQANDVYLQYQRQVARDKAETLKKRSERNLDGKLKINNLELVFLTINSRRWFGISQIVSVLFSHRPRSSVVTRMKMLGIEFYCGNYDELRRMKELGGVETHCSRCKLISEQDLVKLLLCFYRFTALPRGKGKISTNGLSTYLDDILREIAMGRVELGKDFHEDDTGKIDDDTWSQISERMLLKNAERVEHFTRGPPPKKKDAFTFDVDNEAEFVMPGSPSRYIPRSQRVTKGQKPQPKIQPILERAPPSPPQIATTQLNEEEKTTKSTSSGKESVVKDENKQESMSLLLPKLIRAERTKKPPRAIWPRWYPPTGEGDDKDDNRPTITLKSSPSFPLSGVSLPAIQCLLNHFRVVADKDKEEKTQYVIDGKHIDPEDVKEVKIKRDTGEECIVSLEDLSFKDIKFGEDDIIQIVTRQDLEDQYNKQKSETSSRKNSDEQSDSENKEGTEKKEPSPPKPEPVEYTPEQLEYVQKLKESFDFPYAFPRNKMAMKKEPNDYDMYDEETFLMRSRLPHYRRNPIVDNQIFRKLMLQKRPTILNKKQGKDGFGNDVSQGSSMFAEESAAGQSSLLNTPNGSSTVYPGPVESPLRNGQVAKNSVLRPKGSIIKSKLIKCHLLEKGGRTCKEDGEIKVARDRVQSEPVAKPTGKGRVRNASDSAIGVKESGRESPFLLSDDSGTVSDGELTDGGDPIEQRNRPRKRFRKFSSSRERLGSGGSSECDEETVKPDHVYRFKFKSVSETQDYPYMSARPSSLLKLVKLDKCDYPVGCRSAPFLFDTRPLPRLLDRGPFVRQYDIEPTSENVWSGVSLWAGDDSSDNMSDTSSNNGSSHSAPETLKCPAEAKKTTSSLMRKIASAGNSPIRRSSESNIPSESPQMSGLDILSSVAYNADRLRNTPTKRQRTPRKQPQVEQRLSVKHGVPLKLQVRHIRVASKRKPEIEDNKEISKSRKLDT
ncbi:hypothetical protein ACHWQZ_G007316 [Mnemiopsis leidyi]